jgi:drug/metabolite transporter (DMT)-like permease
MSSSSSNNNNYGRGATYAFITAVLYAAEAILSKVLNERHKSIYVALLTVYVILYVIFGINLAWCCCCCAVVEDDPMILTAGEESGFNDDVEKHQRIDMVVKDSGVGKKLTLHKKYDSYSFLPSFLAGKKNKKDEEEDEKKKKKKSFTEYGYKDDFCFGVTLKALSLIAMSVFDFGGNYTAILAYKYTSVTSATIFLSATVPISCCMGYFFINRRYTRRHVVGASIACAALVLLVVSDEVEEEKELHDDIPGEEQKNPALGDSLAFAAAVCNSLTNVLQEHAIENGVYMNEILTAFGFYGALLAFVALLWEHDWDLEKLGNFLKSVGKSDVMIYIVFAVVILSSFPSAYRSLKYIDAGSFNVILLQQALLCGLVRLFGFDGGFSTTEQAFIFMGTFAVQAVGIAIFSTAEDPKSNIGSENGGNSSSSSSSGTENNSNNSNSSSASERRDNEVDEKTPLVRASSSSSP